MSLKAFHIFFIVASIVLSAFFSAWCFQEYGVVRHVGFLVAGVGGLSAGVSLIFYLMWFIKKLRKVHLAWLFVIGLSAGKNALACPVCIGDPNAPATQSANAAILFLLVVITAVLGALGTTFLVWRSRAQKLQQNSSLEKHPVSSAA